VLHSSDTIFAVSSGAVRAGVAVIRVSGAQTTHIVQVLAGTVPPPRLATLRILRDPNTQDTLDHALVLFFKTPHSFTGEDVAEFHVHGSLAVQSALLDVLGRFQDTRPAEAGEFTRRALLNGKLDLTQVEALGDLLDAETPAQHRQALFHYQGGLTHTVMAWREDLIHLSAQIEASIDFSDEGDVPLDVWQRAQAKVQHVCSEITQALASDYGERVREGYRVVLAGHPNAGKSTLLNTLAKRDVALVSDIPGTTRDSLEVRVQVAGLPITLTDTAGLRDTTDPIESLGIARTKEHMQYGDCVIWLHDAREPFRASDIPADAMLVFSKTDDVPYVRLPNRAFACSAKTGEGIQALLVALAERLQGNAPKHEPLITRARHRAALQEVARALERVVAQPDLEFIELVAEDLRLALRGLARVTGHIDIEHVLDALFSSFCIGK
jgi:tRNA modification GTPase